MRVRWDSPAPIRSRFGTGRCRRVGQRVSEGRRSPERERPPGPVAQPYALAGSARLKVVEQPSEQPRHRSRVDAFMRQWTGRESDCIIHGRRRLQLVMRGSDRPDKAIRSDGCN